MIKDYAYYDLFNQDSIHKELRIEYDNTILSNEHIYSEDFQLIESICSDSQLTFGACEPSELRFKMQFDALSLFNKIINVSLILDHNEDTLFPLGTYRVSGDTPSAEKDYRNIVAYDLLNEMINVDVSDWYNSVLPNKNSKISMREFRRSFVNHFGIEEKDSTQVLKNDEMVIERTIEPEELSGKVTLTAICEINGCFGHMSRDGKFDFIYLAKDMQGLYPMDTLYPRDDLYPRDPKGERIPHGLYYDCEYEDYLTESITKVQLRQSENDIGCTYGTGNNTYVVEDNFLIYGKGHDELEKIAKNLYAAVSYIVYRPAKIVAKGNPCLEVGDPIRLNTTHNIVETHILKRVLSGIQSLQDNYSSEGAQTYNQSINSVGKSIVQLKGKTNLIIRTVDENRQEMLDVTNGLHSLILQTAGQIVLKVDGNGKIVQVELGVDASKGAEFKVKADNISMTAAETINFMSGGDLNLTGKNIKITSDKFKVDKDGNVQCNNITAFSISGEAVKQFNQTVDDSEALQLAWSAINKADTTIKNLNETIIPQINDWIKQLSNQLQELGKPGIS